MSFREEWPRAIGARLHCQFLLRGSPLLPLLEKQEEQAFADRVWIILGRLTYLFLPCRQPLLHVPLASRQTPDQFTEFWPVEMCVFIDDHDVAGAPGESIMPIGGLRTVPVVMMVSFVDGDKGARLKNIVSV
jgi:hypothetical protein